MRVLPGAGARRGRGGGDRIAWWPPVAAALARLEQVGAGLPATLWLALMLGRLFLGQFLPRI